MTRKYLFRNRTEAGRLLARQLSAYAGRADTLVLALARGGVPVGFEVAHALRLPFDVVVVRKLGVPGHEELAMGAIASGGGLVRNEPVIAAFQVSPVELEATLHRESAEVLRREQAYRGARPPARIEGKTIIVVDDGIATGSTLRAAVRALATGRPSTIVAAAPVIAAEAARELKEDVDDVVAIHTSDDLQAIGQFYADFHQTTDDEVRRLLARCATEHGCLPPGETIAHSSRDIRGPGKGRMRIPPQWEWNFRTLVGLRNHLQRGCGDRMREPSDTMAQPSQHGSVLAGEQYDRNLALALPANTAEALHEVNEAIRRIENGTYGICEATGRKIDRADLQTIPWRRNAPTTPTRPQAKGRRVKVSAKAKKLFPLGRRGKITRRPR